jgi:ABC-type transporter Mla subunit MlaD
MPTTEVLPASARSRAALAALFAAASLAACVAPKPLPPPPPPPVAAPPVVKCDPPREPQDLAARHLLATEDRFSALNTADLTAEATHNVEGATIEQQMDQALALSMTHAPGDLGRALTLLDQVLHNNTPQADPWRSLARLLAYRLGEQKRAEDAVERAAQQLRDAQRDNQRKLDDANSKLEALKAIERSLNTRQAPPASAPRP